MNLSRRSILRGLCRLVGAAAAIPVAKAAASSEMPVTPLPSPSAAPVTYGNITYGTITASKIRAQSIFACKIPVNKIAFPSISNQGDNHEAG